MDPENSLATSYDSTSASRSVFLCQKLPNIIWDLTHTTFPWILVFITSIASPIITFLNATVIVALKKRRELKKQSNILLCSMAFTDLLTGAITMPLSATTVVLMLSQVSLEHICTLDSLVTKPIIFLMSLSSLFHLTAIAWERYMAIKCGMEYKSKVTESLLKKFALTAWVLPFFKQGLTVIIMANSISEKFLGICILVQAVVVLGCSIAIAYFYFKVLLGVRRQKKNKTSQVSVLLNAKLESKIATTTGLVTAALLFSFVFSVVIVILGSFSPIFRMNSTFQLAELVLQLNSLLNPILYCYSDRRFKNAVQELLGLKKTQKIQPTFHANRCLRRKESFQSVEMKLQGEEIFIVQSTKSAPSEPPVEHEGASSVNMERSISGYCSDSFAQCNVQIPEPLSVHTTTAVIHSQSSRQCGYRISKEKVHPVSPTANDAVSSQGSANRTLTTRSNTCGAEPSELIENIAKKCELESRGPRVKQSQ